MEELKRKCEDLRREQEKRKEHVREEAMRRAKALTEDNKQLQRCSHGYCCYGHT